MNHSCTFSIVPFQLFFNSRLFFPTAKNTAATMTPSTTTTFFVCSGRSVTSHKSSPEKTYKAIRNEFRQFFIPFHASPTANASHAIFRHQQHVRRRNTQSQHHSSSHPPCWEYGSRPGRTVGIYTWRWKHRWHPRRIVGIEWRIDNDFTLISSDESAA